MRSGSKNPKKSGWGKERGVGEKKKSPHGGAVKRKRGGSQLLAEDGKKRGLNEQRMKQQRKVS